MRKHILTTSFAKINADIANMMASREEAQRPYCSFVDASGVFHTFPTQRDYLAYLDEQDLESIGKKS